MSRSQDRRPGLPVIAVVGSGFSGTLVAVHLARLCAAQPVRVVLFERGERVARGIAYGTNSPHLLLNVPAGMMSALVDEPDHFLNWLQARDGTAQAGTFAPRRLYGEYLGELLAEASSGGGTTIETIRSEVVDLRIDGGGVTLMGPEGALLRADRAVLALGNPGPQDPLCCTNELKQSRKYISDPWEQGLLEGLDGDDGIVLIGSGLTAVDVIVEAAAAGLNGPITIVSRHGLLPHRHRPVAPRPMTPIDESPLTVRGVLRHLRREASLCEREGGDWRAVIDALRPAVPGLWRALGLAERGRFLRHLSARWDVHRHRVAPAIAQVVQDALDAGRLSVVAGRVAAIEELGDGVHVSVRPRGGAADETLFARRVINCTGPSRDIRQGHSPLVAALIARGLGRTDPLSLGLEASESRALIDRDGHPSDRLFALGPILKGQFWETTAVRELRVQTLDLAHHLAASVAATELLAAPAPLSARLLRRQESTSGEPTRRIPLRRLGKSA